MNNIGQVSQVTFPFQLQGSHDKKEDVHEKAALPANSRGTSREGFTKKSVFSPRAEGITARWTEEEDQNLIRLYKRDLAWKEIAAQIPQRTEKSCVRHWEYLQKRVKTNGNRQLLKWTEEEDKDLIELYKQGLDWKDISIQLLSGKTSEQCRDHWRYELQTRIEENEKGQLQEIQQQRWESIFQQRTQKREAIFISSSKEDSLTSCNSEEADSFQPCSLDELIAIPAALGENTDFFVNSSLEVSRELAGSAEKMAQKRESQVKEETGNEKWTEEEDQHLIKLYKQGLAWKEIAAQIPNRTEKSCGRHCEELKKRMKKNGNGQLLEIEQQRQKSNGPTRVEWTEEENKDLIKLYKQDLNWKEIAAQIPNRTAKSCERHWEQLQERIKKNGNGQLLEIKQQRQKSIEHPKGYQTGLLQLREEEEQRIILKQQFLPWKQIEMYFPMQEDGLEESTSSELQLVEPSPFEEFMETGQKSLKKRERATEESEGDRVIKRARVQLSSFIPIPSRLSQGVISTGDFTQWEAFTDLIEPKSVSDSLAFFDANFPNNSEDTFSATSSAETPMHHDNQIMTQQENTDKSYEEYFDCGLH